MEINIAGCRKYVWVANDADAVCHRCADMKISDVPKSPFSFKIGQKVRPSPTQLDSKRINQRLNLI